MRDEGRIAHTSSGEQGVALEAHLEPLDRDGPVRRRPPARRGCDRRRLRTRPTKSAAAGISVGAGGAQTAGQLGPGEARTDRGEGGGEHAELVAPHRSAGCTAPSPSAGLHGELGRVAHHPAGMRVHRTTVDLLLPEPVAVGAALVVVDVLRDPSVEQVLARMRPPRPSGTSPRASSSRAYAPMSMASRRSTSAVSETIRLAGGAGDAAAAGGRIGVGSYPTAVVVLRLDDRATGRVIPSGPNIARRAGRDRYAGHVLEARPDHLPPVVRIPEALTRRRGGWVAQQANAPAASARPRSPTTSPGCGHQVMQRDGPNGSAARATARSR